MKRELGKGGGAMSSRAAALAVIEQVGATTHDTTAAISAICGLLLRQADELDKLAGLVCPNDPLDATKSPVHTTPNSL